MFHLSSDLIFHAVRSPHTQHVLTFIIQLNVSDSLTTDGVIMLLEAYQGILFSLT